MYDQSSASNSPRPITTLSALFGRIFWSGLGPILVIALSLAIVRSGSGWLTWLDLTYAIVVVLMMVGRLVELRSGSATTLAGEAVGSHAFRRYAWTSLPILVGIWAAANVLGNHVLE